LIVMLTKDDLKEIRKIVREEVEVEVGDAKDSIQSDLLHWRLQTQNDIRGLSDKVKNLEIRIGSLEKETKKGFRDIKKKLKTTVEFFDKDHLRNLERIERVERHLSLTPVS